MAAFTKQENGSWKVAVRRYGRHAFRRFPTRPEAEVWAAEVEEEWRQVYEMNTRLYQRNGALMSAWQLARFQLLSGRDSEPDDEAIAATIAHDPTLKYIARLHLVPQTTKSVLAERDHLEELMQRAVADATEDHRKEDDLNTAADLGAPDATGGPPDDKEQNSTA
jgi:hypothetical protein